MTKRAENDILTQVYQYCGRIVRREQKGRKAVKARVAFRKTAAFLLAFALLCGLFPVSAHAAPASLWERLFWNAEPRSEELTDEQRDENVRIATAFLRQELKLPDSAVAAVLANIYRESAFDPLAVDGDREFFGLCQWSKLRWTNCFFFCREQGLDRLSMEGQLAFLKYELEGEYLWVYETFLLPAADDEDGAQEAQYSFCEFFEVPLDLDWEQVVRSKLVAYAYWPYVSEGKALDWNWTT